MLKAHLVAKPTLHFRSQVEAMSRLTQRILGWVVFDFIESRL